MEVSLYFNQLTLVPGCLMLPENMSWLKNSPIALLEFSNKVCLIKPLGKWIQYFLQERALIW
jgi:hypothetical protein